MTAEPDREVTALPSDGSHPYTPNGEEDDLGRRRCETCGAWDWGFMPQEFLHTRKDRR